MCFFFFFVIRNKYEQKNNLKFVVNIKNFNFIINSSTTYCMNVIHNTLFLSLFLIANMQITHLIIIKVDLHTSINSNISNIEKNISQTSRKR